MHLSSASGPDVCVNVPNGHHVDTHRKHDSGVMYSRKLCMARKVYVCKEGVFIAKKVYVCE
jgi:hypothetical protein